MATSATAKAQTLTDEQRILRLLEAHDGEMWQKEIVAEMSWSEPKTGQVLADLEDAGELHRLRIGAENLVSFDDPVEGTFDIEF